MEPDTYRVILNNPGGYNNYQGTVKRVFSIGNQEWADIEWDMPVHPCTTPMETRHLILVNKNSVNFSDYLDAVNHYGDAEREFGKLTRPVTEEDREKVRVAKVTLLQMVNSLFGLSRD